MNKREKYLIIATVALLLLLAIKSFVLDPYNPTEAETPFYERVQGIIESEYDGALYDYNIVNVKIIKISEMSEKEKTVEKDGETIVAQGIYKAKIRKYFLGILPFSQETILDHAEE